MAGSAALAFRIFATDNTSKTFDKIGRSADSVAGKLAGIGKVGTIAALGVAALGVSGVAAFAGLAVGVAGIAAGLAGVGLAFAAQNSRVQHSFSALSTRVQSDMRGMSSVFVPVLLHLSDVLGGVFDRARPKLTKAFASLAPVAQRMVDGIGGALDGLVPAIGPAVAAATPLLNRIADVMPAIGRAAGRMIITVSGWMQQLTPHIKPALNRAVSAAKTGAGKIGDGIAAVLNSSAVTKVKGAWPGLVDTVTDGVSAMAVAAKDKAVDVGTGLFGGIKKGLDTGDWSGLGKTLGGLVRDQVSKAFKVATTITESLGRAISSVDWVGLGIDVGKEAPSLAGGFVAGLFNFDIGNALSGIGDHWRDILLGLLAIAFTPAKVIGKIAGLLDRIPLVGPLLGWILRGTKKAADGAVGAGGKLVGAIGKGIMSGFRKVFPTVGARFTIWLTELPTRIGLARIAATEKAKKMVGAIGDAILSGAEAVGRAIGTIIGKITKPFADAGGWLVGKGRDAIVGLGKGIKSALGPAAGTLRSIGGRVVGWVGDLSKVLFGAGKSLITGFVSGIKSAFGKVKSALEGLTGKLPGWKGPPARDATLLVGNGQLVMGGFIAGLESRYAQVRQSLAGLTGSLTAPGVTASATGGRSAGVAAAAAGMAHQITINTGPAPADPREIGAAVAWALRTGGA